MMITKDNAVFTPPANETDEQKAIRVISKLDYALSKYVPDLKAIMQIFEEVVSERDQLRDQLNDMTDSRNKLLRDNERLRAELSGAISENNELHAALKECRQNLEERPTMDREKAERMAVEEVRRIRGKSKLCDET